MANMTLPVKILKEWLAIKEQSGEPPVFEPTPESGLTNAKLTPAADASDAADALTYGLASQSFSRGILHGFQQDHGVFRRGRAGQQPFQGYTISDHTVDQRQYDLTRAEYEKEYRRRQMESVTRMLHEDGKVVLDPADLANALHRSGASLDLIHETADWLETSCPGFDRMQFLSAIDWGKPAGRVEPVEVRDPKE